MTAWSLVFDGFDPEKEGLREALCTLGNGYFATRGASEWGHADDVHYPGTYVAGCYNRVKSEVAERTIETENLVNVPNWLPVTLRTGDDGWFDIGAVDILDYRQVLNMRKGLLLRRIRFRDKNHRITSIASERLVHMAHPHLAALKIKICPENWSGTLTIRSGIDGRVENRGVQRYRELESHHLVPLEALSQDEFIFLTMCTSQSHIRIAEAARHWVSPSSSRIKPVETTHSEPGYVAQEFALQMKKGETVDFEKIVSLYTSQDAAASEPDHEARKVAKRVGSYNQLRESHERAWQALWNMFAIDIAVAGTKETERVNRTLRLHIFHLLQTLSPHTMDMDVGTPARGLHGEAYRGHIFWDELFILPFFNLRMPEIARGLLKYRYHRLDEARFAARDAGYDGAMYPWQSGSNGREESQKWHLNPHSGRWLPDHSHLQRHINAAIAFNVWQYYQASGDVEFLSFYGAEMLIEIARFWASASTYNPQLGRYEINGVMGPDEYHDGYPNADAPGIDNNAYTNVMAAWALWRATELPDHLPHDQMERLRSKLALGENEFAEWDKISRNLRVVFHVDGIISQFEGYENLRDFDWSDYHNRYGDIQRLDRILEAEDDSPNNYKLSKQADVLMLFYLFSAQELHALFERLDYPFETEFIQRNIDYYMARTSHGSTLSRMVSSWVLSRLDRSKSWSLFNEALNSDISDTQNGTTAEGIHLGAMAGAVDIIQRCYTGIEMREGVLWINPRLPAEVECISMPLRYRRRSFLLKITASHLHISVHAGAGPNLPLGVMGKVYELAPGEDRTFPHDGLA